MTRPPSRRRAAILTLAILGFGLLLIFAALLTNRIAGELRAARHAELRAAASAALDSAAAWLRVHGDELAPGAVQTLDSAALWPPAATGELTVARAADTGAATARATVRRGRLQVRLEASWPAPG
jgi:hypothetical protein